jgi:hemin uptake protein HemP
LTAAAATTLFPSMQTESKSALPAPGPVPVPEQRTVSSTDLLGGGRELRIDH